MLVNLTRASTIEFDRFPGRIQTRAQVNWDGQDVTIGMRPLFYANREPRELLVEDLWLDGTLRNASIQPQLAELEALADEGERGTPSVLLAQWGDEQYRCVLRSVELERVRFAPSGEPLRARVSLTLLEVGGEERPRVVAQRVRRNEESSFTF
ncbi:MAG: hypothetical protein IRY83_13785 [Chloroflexi bacterium]|nr:hypothetical protein [Chloroflexota bacterium]